MVEVDERIIENGVKLFERRFNSLFTNALMRTDEIKALCDAVPGMRPNDAVVWLFFKMIPQMLKSTPQLTNEGRIALGDMLAQEIRQVVMEASDSTLHTKH